MLALDKKQSGWIINFKDGSKLALSENAYEKYNEENNKKFVSSEEHWFDIQNGINKYNIPMFFDESIE